MRDNRENEVYYLGIDHGNHLMKGVNYIMENKANLSANTLVYDGYFYKIGESRMNVKDNKLDDDAYYLLTLVLMAKEAITRELPYGTHVVLGVGMPLKQFATVRKQFVKHLMREKQPVHFRYEDQAFEFTI